jgi:hypothetical protein
MHDYWQGRGIKVLVPRFDHLSDLFSALDTSVRKWCVRAAERLNKGEPVTVIVDSTGLRFSHAGAWYAEKYGKKAERTSWRMMHLAMANCSPVASRRPMRLMTRRKIAGTINLCIIRKRRTVCIPEKIWLWPARPR